MCVCVNERDKWERAQRGHKVEREEEEEEEEECTHRPVQTRWQENDDTLCARPEGERERKREGERERERERKRRREREHSEEEKEKVLERK